MEENQEHTISITLPSSRPHSVLLQGFDRSGSSAIARTLAQHPDIELFMQPFNGWPVRQKMYNVWNQSTASEEDKSFFEGLQEGILQRDYITSHWFEEYSTSFDFVPGKLHLIKTTINHFLSRWMRENYPDIHLWSIWREPLDIMTSIIRNDFAGQWYVGAIKDICEGMKDSEELMENYGREIEKKHDAIGELALLIAIRSHFLFRHTPSGQIIDYEVFRENARLGLSPFTTFYEFDDVLFQNEQDQNIVGRAFEKTTSHRGLISEQEMEVTQRIFAPLRQLLYEKHGVQST